MSKKPDERTSVPTNFPATNPPLPSGDYTYILEIVMNMQSSIGRLTEAVDTMKIQSANHDKKLEEIGRDVHAAKTTVKVVGAILAAFLAFAGWAISQGVSAFVQLRQPAPSRSQSTK